MENKKMTLIGEDGPIEIEYTDEITLAVMDPESKESHEVMVLTLPDGDYYFFEIMPDGYVASIDNEKLTETVLETLNALANE